MRRFSRISPEKKSAKPSKKGTSAAPVAVVPDTVLAVAAPTLTAIVSQSEHPVLPGPSNTKTFDVTLDLAITACNVIKNIGDTIPGKAGGPIKGTFGVLVLVLETVKRCKENREGWKSIAELIVEKNKRVESLLQLYARASEDHPNALEQALNYQRVLNNIAMDMKKETEKPEENTLGLESYWSRMKTIGREAALSNINAARITSYREQLRTIALDVLEETVVRGAVVAVETHSVAVDIRRIVQNIADQPKPTERTIPLKPRPRVVEDFIGREDILSAMHCTHFEDQTTRDRPIITVLTGMGGSGKSQIAVKFASQFEERFPDLPVYFLNALSRASLEADLKTLLQSQTAKYEDALVWLATGVPNWLLIMDNADDPSLDLSKYLPHSSHGHIVVTTRNETHRAFAPHSTHVVEVLPLEESITLLLRSSGCEDNDNNRLLAKDIVEEVGRLPLAISHAAAYICVHGRLGTYLETYRKRQLQFLDKRPTQAYGYPRSVASTIQLSYECLSLKAQQLLQLFSYLDIQSISRSIIERAAERSFIHVARKTEIPLNDNTIEYANVLQGIFCPEGESSNSKLDDIVEECLKYSLIKSTVVGEVYSMHPLVQAYLHSALLSAPVHSPQRLVTRLLASSITHDPDGGQFMFNRLLLPHIRLVDVEDVTEAGDHYGIGDILKEFGDGLAITHLQRCLNIWGGLLGPDHLDTLAAMQILANTYSSVGRSKDALPLEEEVLEKRRKLLGPDHLETLKAMQNLANTYQSLGRSKDALPLKEEVLEKRKKLLSPDHPNILAAMSNLAGIYESLGRSKDALPLKEEVLEKWRKMLGPDHLHTLMAMNNLASTYSSLGRPKDALPLKEEVLEKRRKMLGPDHLETLAAINNLANTYESLGRSKDALPLKEEVLEKRRNLLGPDHLKTLNAMQNLANTYDSLGRSKDALPLKEEVLEKRRNLLGPDHLDTLKAMSYLANTYHSLGRPKDALLLQEEVLEKRRKFLGVDHRGTVETMYKLLLTYDSLGMNTKLEELGREALPLLESVYGEDKEWTVWVKKRMEQVHGRGGLTGRDSIFLVFFLVGLLSFALYSPLYPFTANEFDQKKM